jgi:hypothetical protein
LTNTSLWGLDGDSHFDACTPLNSLGRGDCRRAVSRQ